MWPLLYALRMRQVQDWKPLLEAASSDIRRLSYVTRYSSIPVSVPENVAEHMYWVSIYAMMVHRHLEGPKELDAIIMLHGLTHDALESLSGDIVRTFKYSSEEFRAAVDRAESGLAAMLPAEIKSLLDEVESEMAPSKWSSLYVKDVVKAADFMSLYQYMWREKRRGNVEVEQFHGRMIEDLRTYSKGIRQREESNRISLMGSNDSLRVASYMPYLPSLAVLYEDMREGFMQRFTVK